MAAGALGEPLERVFREEWGAIVATLARRLGDLQAAEDAAAEAFAAAADAWGRDGMPPKPGGWLKFDLGWLQPEQAIRNLETSVSLLQTAGNTVEELDSLVKCLSDRADLRSCRKT